MSQVFCGCIVILTPNCIGKVWCEILRGWLFWPVFHGFSRPIVG